MATGQPVGSKTLVEGAGLDVSPSTVRYELADLERIGLLTHPHTSAGRVPTETGYRLYVDELLARPEVAPERLRARAPRRARRGGGCAPDDDRDALAGDAPAGARLGAAARGGHGAPRRGAAAPARGRDGRRDHVDGRRHRSALRVPRAGRPGSRDVGGRLSERARSPARMSARARSRSRSTSRASSPRERAFLLVIRSAFEHAADEDRRLFVGGAAGLLDEMRVRGDRRLPQPDGRAREAGGAPRHARAAPRPAPSVRACRRGARAAGSARARARRRDLRHGATGRSAPSACSGRCAWTTRRRCVRCARPRPSCRASSKRSTRTTDEHRPRLLRAARRRPRRRRRRRSRRRSAGSPASCIPTSRASRSRRCASVR